MDAPLRFRIAPGRSRTAPSRVSALGEVQEEEEKEDTQHEKRVIAPIADAWRPKGREPLAFEAETKDGDVSKEPFGLQVKNEGGKVDGRENKKGDHWLGREGKLEWEDQDLPEPASLQVRLRERTSCLSEKCWEMEWTDDGIVTVAQDYQEMPVENFGEALLRGMGWEKGKPVGRNPKGSVEAREYVRRPERLGLGAKPKEIQPRMKKRGRLGEPDKSEKNMIMLDEHGNVKHTKTLDEKLVSRDKLGMYVGKAVVIQHGPHEGLLGKVVGIDGKHDSTVAKVVLELSGETVEVNSQLLGSPYERSETSSLPTKRSNQKGETTAQHKMPKLESQDPKRQGRRTRGWLFPNIRVRIIDKTFHGGKFYLKKGYVLDVITPTSCDLVLDEGSRHVSDVDQDLLETVIPRNPGSPVQILRGEYKGERGDFVSKDSSRGTTTIQLGIDYSVKTFSMDDVAEIQVHR